MQVHEVVAATMAELGVHTAFGLMGDANMLVIADFVHAHDGRFVRVVDERNSVAMAGGYAAATGTTAVATVTHGPGLTHAMTSIVEVARGGLPVVIVTGDAPILRDYPQWFDIRGLANLAGAGYEKVWGPETASEDTVRAFRRAAAEHRPIVLDVAREQLERECGDFRFEGFVATTGQQTRPDADALDNALGLAVSSQRPVVLAGRGAVRADAHDALVELADLLGAPLATSLLAKDYFRGHPLDLGICGTVATPVALDRMANADGVLAFGATLNQYTTDRGRIFQNARVVHVDVDATRFGSFVNPTVPIIGDARIVAEEMVQHLRAADFDGAPRDEDLVAALAAQPLFDDYPEASDPETIDLRTAMIALDRVVPARRNLVTDIGRSMFTPWRGLHVDDPLGFVPAANFTSIGLGLGTAIGVATARPDRPTIAFVGDGGFMQAATELRTAVNEGLPLIVVIANDGAYGAEWRKLALHGFDPGFSRNQWPDFVPLAEAHGARGFTVRSVEDIEKLEPELADQQLPILLDVRIDPAADYFV